MKETIKYAYNIEIKEINTNFDYSWFDYNGCFFYFVPLNRKEKDLEDIVNCSKELIQKGIPCHGLILNKNNSLLTKFENKNYILLKIEGDISKEYNINDILDINNKLLLTTTKSELYRNNWGEMWSSKVDYFEYQIRELGKDKKVILDSFSYYIGLCENAISYVNKTSKVLQPTAMDRVTLSHRRLFYPNIKLNYLNPLSFIFDLEVRDVAEYIKMLFFYGEGALTELEIFLRLRPLSQYGYQMLYGRLLYPTYYFDIYEKIMNENYSEDKLLDIIKKVDEYELFLKNVYYDIQKYSPIEGVEWIINKKEL